MRTRFWFSCVSWISRSLISALLFGLAGPARAEPRQLNLFIWSEYIDPAVVASFEQRFDCRVTVDVYEEEESMMSKLLGGGDALYDVIVPSNQLVPALIKLNLLARLPYDAIPSLRNLDPHFTNPPYDPANHYTVPFQWGTLGIYLRKPKDRPVEESWSLLFDPKKLPGPFLLIDSYREMIGAALQYQGHGLNATNVAQLKNARDLLLATKRRSLGFEGSVGCVERVASGQAVAAVVYNGDAVRRMGDYPGTYFFVPREGSEIWVDNLAVPTRAPHRDLALRFLNFILDARVGAQQSNWSHYATPNHAAKAFIKPADLQNPAIYPTPETMKRLEFTQELGVQSRLYDEIWTVVKSK
ncbi:MAG: polyamine ABC transporter substrate-binding protein [Limisphaerales bacterium]